MFTVHIITLLFPH